MFSLVFSKEEGWVDSVKVPQHSKYFLYSISLIMEKIEQQAVNLKLKKQKFYFLVGVVILSYILCIVHLKWAHFTILVCTEYFNVSDSEYW